MFKKDYMERQIEAISNTFAAILFGKDKVKTILDIEQEENAVDSMEDDILERMIKKYVSEMKFNEAENLIFNSINEKKTAKKFELALYFFNEANKYDEDALKKHNYSKDEIVDGINHLKKLY